jgi:hypothetical protein
MEILGFNTTKMSHSTAGGVDLTSAGSNKRPRIENRKDTQKLPTSTD